jgi:hypothetical protein
MASGAHVGCQRETAFLAGAPVGLSFQLVEATRHFEAMN